MTASGLALADSNSLSQDEIYVVDPEGTNDRAVHQPGRIPWCEGAFTLDVWSKDRLLRAVQSGYAPMTGTTWLDGVEHLCQWADDPSWQKQATYVVQQVMNGKDVSQDEAVEKLKRWVALNKKERDNEGKPPSDEDRFAFEPRHLKDYAREPYIGVDKAKLTGTAPWCDAAGQIKDKWTAERIARTFGARWGIQSTVEAALHICQRPNDPTWKEMAGNILQHWMNFTRQSQVEAEASLRRRIQIEKFQAEHDELCKALEYSPELGGQARAYAEAHRDFFACTSVESNNALGQPLWQKESNQSGDFAFYFDVDDKLESEVIRLAWLFHQTDDPEPDLPKKDAMSNRPLLEYAVASVDFEKIDTAALNKLLETPPFANDYARAIVSESAAQLRWRKKFFDQAIDKLGKDPDYTAVLREAPKKGFEQWEKVTAPWKAEIERSNAFEKKLSSPSRKVLAGCAPELHKDAQKLIQSYKLKDYNALVSRVAGDPVAALLLSRLSVCMAYEKLPGSGVLRDLVKNGRDLRGPRSLAYYAIVEALAEVLKDRPKLLVNMSNFHYRGTRLTDLYQYEFNFTGLLRREAEKSGGGIVKSVKKVRNGVEITFKEQKVTWPELDCVDDLRHPLKIRSDGTIEYYQRCKETGKTLSQDETPGPMVVAPLLASGLTAGAYVVGEGGSDSGFVLFVKGKSTDKTIKTFYGFDL